MSSQEKKKNGQNSAENPASQYFNQPGVQYQFSSQIPNPFQQPDVQYQFSQQIPNPFQQSQQQANQQRVANPFQQSQPQGNPQPVALIPFPLLYPAAYNFIDPVQIGITQEQCKEGIQRLENSESIQINGLEKIKKLEEIAMALKPDQVPEPGIQEKMLQLIKEIENDSGISVDDTKESKKLFTQIVSACKDLSEHKEQLAEDIKHLKSNICDLVTELKIHKERTETSESKVVNLEKEIEIVRTQANEQISALEEKISKLNEQLMQSQEEKAKSVISQVMTVVPTLMVKMVFPQHPRYKKVYSFSELENMVTRLPESNEAEKADKSAKRTMLDNLTTRVDCSTKDLEEFIRIFKENCGGCRSSLTSELNKKVIEESILILLKESIIDESDEQKCLELAKLWEQCQSRSTLNDNAV